MTSQNRYFIELSYNGTNYHGWQTQKNSTSIQSVINDVLSLKLKEEINVTGAGRTDTGVHAKYFIAHFDTKSSGIEANEKILFSLNKLLPTDIAIHKIIKVHKDAHSRFDATSRTYEYHIINQKSPFETNTAYFYLKRLNIGKMNEAAEILISYNDFASFCKLHSDNKTTICKIYKAIWIDLGGKLIFTIKADRFLRNMVRAITGTLIDIGLGKIDMEKFKQIIELKNRKEAGRSVPAKGLFLTDIEYPYIKRS